MSPPPRAKADQPSPVPASREEALRQEDEIREQVKGAFRSVRSMSIEGWQDSRTKINALRDRLKKSLVDRDEAISGLLAAIISRSGCVLLGPPGTAKSAMVTRIAKECQLRIGGNDANYFEYLLTAHTMPEEIFGPTDIGKLLADPPQVERRTEARLPHAELAFLDEVFRGGSHILNTLLTLVNERKFHNGRTAEKVPLVSVIGAANQPPQTEELQAFFDRFPVRIWVDSVLSVPQPSMVTRAKELIDAHSSLSAEVNTVSDRPSMTDFRRLWGHLQVSMRIPKDTSSRGDGGLSRRLQEYTNNFMTFKAEGDLSDRSFVQLWYFSGALDLVEGKSPGDDGADGHFDCFRYIAPSMRSNANIETRLEGLKARRSSGGN
jgi:MoxR-like ATPase